MFILQSKASHAGNSLWRAERDRRGQSGGADSAQGLMTPKGESKRDNACSEDPIDQRHARRAPRSYLSCDEYLATQRRKKYANRAFATKRSVDEDVRCLAERILATELSNVPTTQSNHSYARCVCSNSCRCSNKFCERMVWRPQVECDRLSLRGTSARYLFWWGAKFARSDASADQMVTSSRDRTGSLLLSIPLIAANESEKIVKKCPDRVPEAQAQAHCNDKCAAGGDTIL